LNIAAKRYSSVLLPNFRLKWLNTWQKQQSKEAGFIWVMWNKAIAINMWRTKANTEVDHGCKFWANHFSSSPSEDKMEKEMTFKHIFIDQLELWRGIDSTEGFGIVSMLKEHGSSPTSSSIA
jgi:hypothetical protein